MKIKNIVFDVGRVLVTYEPAQHLRNLGYDEPTRRSVMEAMFANPLWNENDKGVLTTKELIDAFVANAPEYEKQIREAFQKIDRTIELMPYSLEWILELKSRGYHLYIISNYGEYTYEKTKHKLKFLPYIDGTIFSFQYKMIKPDKQIYETLLEKFELQAEESVFIDDSLANIVAAKEAGFHGIHFQSYEQAKMELDQLLESETED